MLSALFDNMTKGGTLCWKLPMALVLSLGLAVAYSLVFNAQFVRNNSFAEVSDETPGSNAWEARDPDDMAQKVALLNVMMFRPDDNNITSWGGTSTLCTALYTFGRSREESRRNVDLIVFHNVKDGPPQCFNTSTTFYRENYIFFHYISLDDFSARLWHRANLSTAAWQAEKLLRVRRTIPDTKPMWGLLFQEFLGPYAWWGYVDLDGVYGSSRNLFSDKVLNKYDVISGYCRQAGKEHKSNNIIPKSSGHWSAGPFQLFANTERLSSVIAKWIPAWRPFLENGTKYFGLDEWIGKHGIDSMLHAEDNLVQLCKEKTGEEKMFERDFYIMNLHKSYTRSQLVIEWSAARGLTINGKNDVNVFFLHWLHIKYFMGKALDHCLGTVRVLSGDDEFCGVTPSSDELCRVTYENMNVTSNVTSKPGWSTSEPGWPQLKESPSGKKGTSELNPMGSKRMAPS